LQELARPDGTWHYSKSDSESSVKAAGFAFGIAAAVAELTGSDAHQDVWLHFFECFLLRCWSIKMYLMKEIKMPCSPFTAEFYFNVM
jgi:hypothetical protein